MIRSVILLSTVLVLMSIYLLGCKNCIGEHNEKKLYPQEDNAKIRELKERFLKEWRSKDHCYIEYNPSYSGDKDVTWVYPPKELKFANVLHTVNYDTLIFFVTWYTEWEYLGEKHGRTLGIPFILTDSSGFWNFFCPETQFSFEDPINYISEQIKSLNEILIVDSYYMKEDGTLDPTFWYRLFTDPSMWTTLREENKKKSHLLQKSKEEYLKYIEEQEAPNSEIEKIRQEFLNKQKSCFVEGTKITMSDGTTVPIEKIVTGDKILSVDIETMQTEEDRVIKVASPVHNDIVELTFSDGTVNKNTFDHPYYVKDKGWCSYQPEKTKLNYGMDAKQLSVRDTCYKYSSGKVIPIQLKSMKEKIAPAKTYNLSVLSKNNSYFANGIIVNNEQENHLLKANGYFSLIDLVISK